MINGVDWIGFGITFIGTFALGVMFGATITAMVFEQKQKEQEEEKDDIQ